MFSKVKLWLVYNYESLIYIIKEVLQLIDFFNT